MAGQRRREIKFGLAATQVLQLIDMLRQADSPESLQLLHFHLGSQMANIRDIATGVRESARFMLNCISWVSIFSALMSAAASGWIMKVPVRSLTAL